MGIASLKDLYLDELGNLCDAEAQVIRTLPRLAEAARAPELRDLLTRHCEESRLHLERLQLIFTHWGERQPSRRSAGLAGIVQEADGRLNEPATPDIRDAAIIAVAQRMEHYEIAAYGCARTYARRLNRPDEARLLQETLDEEGRADHRLTQMAQAHIVDDARVEADFRATRDRTLRYVPAAHVPGGSVDVFNDRDEELGGLDGLLVDIASGRARYVVVNTGRLFADRRVLLPVGEVRRDDRRRCLRVHLDKDVAERYPRFDRNEFERMSDETARSYEAQLLDLLPEEPAAESTRRPGESAPEWAITGAWVTVPPDRAEDLTDEARAFANEFRPDDVQAEGGRSVAADRPGPVRTDRRVRTDGPLDTPTSPHGDKLR